MISAKCFVCGNKLDGHRGVCRACEEAFDRIKLEVHREERAKQREADGFEGDVHAAKNRERIGECGFCGEQITRGQLADTWDGYHTCNRCRYGLDALRDGADDALAIFRGPMR